MASEFVFQLANSPLVQKQFEQGKPCFFRDFTSLYFAVIEQLISDGVENPKLFIEQHAARILVQQSLGGNCTDEAHRVHAFRLAPRTRKYISHPLGMTPLKHAFELRMKDLHLANKEFAGENEATSGAVRPTSDAETQFRRALPLLKHRKKNTIDRKAQSVLKFLRLVRELVDSNRCENGFEVEIHRIREEHKITLADLARVYCALVQISLKFSKEVVKSSSIYSWNILEYEPLGYCDQPYATADYCAGADLLGEGTGEDFGGLQYRKNN